MKYKLKGFSLIEVLVTVTILTIVGVAISTIVTRSFQGNTKTELIGNVKQNGQAALAIIEKDIRDSDTVVCPSSGTSNVITLLTKNQGQYIRFTMIPESGNTNGAIYKETFIFQTLPVASDQLCILTSVPLDYQPANPKSALIDFNSKSGISLKNVNGNGFTVVKNAGFKDTVKVLFDLGPATSNPGNFQDSLGGSTNSIQFQTTVQIR
jgi:prepilin-type N-terminal cleavage/methylation domain-containing protein